MRLRIVELHGTPRRMGEDFGEQHRAEIQTFYRLRTLNALAQAKQFGGRKVGEAELLAVSAKSLSVTASYDPPGFQELEGIARAAHLSVEQVFAMNGLTDLRDVLAWSNAVPGYETPAGVDGCSSVVVQGDRTRSGRPMGGQTWDLATDNMPFVVGVHRRPKNAPETWALTTVGCLSLIGLNAEGVAIGTTNIRTKDARPGICYLSIIHKALGLRRLEDVEAAIKTKHRAAAHYYWVVGATGEAFGVECTATRAVRTDVSRGALVHCNHVLDPESARLEGSPPTPTESTSCRQQRMQALLDGAREVDAPQLRTFFADHEGGENAVCRHDFAGVSSNGAVIIDPAEPLIWACQGQPCVADWVDLMTGKPIGDAPGPAQLGGPGPAQRP